MDVTAEGKGGEGKAKSSPSKAVRSHSPLPQLAADARAQETAAQQDLSFLCA